MRPADGARMMAKPDRRVGTLFVSTRNKIRELPRQIFMPARRHRVGA